MRLATRGSPLARWQAGDVAARLTAAHPGLDVTLVVVETSGDRQADRPLWEIGGQGVFVKEVQAAVLDGRADAAVHSAKDLPSSTGPGLSLAAVPVRDDPRDVLVGNTLAGLGPGARVATGSVRRRAQLAWLRPDLTFAGLRGNIGTRLAKASGFHAIVVAYAALERLGRRDSATDVLSVTTLVPQVGQGALAVECRSDDDATRRALAGIEHAPSRHAVDAERAFLAAIGSGCELPVGAHAGDGRLEGVLSSLDGRILLRHAVPFADGADPVAVGRAVAHHLLHEAGGGALLADQALAPAPARP